MYFALIIIVAVIGVIALIATLMIGFEQDKTIKEYQQADNPEELRRERSRSYETQSLKQNIPVLLLIYGITFLVSTLAICLFFFLK